MSPGDILSHKSQLQKYIVVKYVFFGNVFGRHLELHKKYYNFYKLVNENSFTRFLGHLNVG